MKQRKNFSELLRYEREQRGWSQDVLAEHLQTNSKTISRWEQGKNLPQSYQRQSLCQLFQKNAGELGLLENDDISSYAFERQDWGDAPLGGHFYGRVQQLHQLQQWIVERRCHVAAIVGLGGIGKTSLCAKAASTAQESFEYIFWRSLQNTPPIEQFMLQCIRFLSDGQSVEAPETFDDQMLHLLRCLKRSRCLLVLDNVESIIQEGHSNGQYHPGFGGYGRLIQMIGETLHRSCLLLTSREKPKEIALSEGSVFPVHVLHLQGIASGEGQELLKEKALIGTQDHWQTLTNLYAGNPLALKIVSDTIREIFHRDIELFLQSGEVSFDLLEDLIDQQFYRLTQQEHSILYWLAIEREPISIETICDDIVPTVTRKNVFTALESLRRRNFIELRPMAKFTLQPVIMEYVTNNFIEVLLDTFITKDNELWRNYVLLKAHSKDFIRISQERLLLVPVGERLLSTLGKKNVREHICEMIQVQRHEAPLQRNYLANNMLRMLMYLHEDLRSVDFSLLAFKQAYFQDVSLHGTNFSQVHFVSSTFKSNFGNILCIAYNVQENSFAMGTATGDVWIYHALSCVALAHYTGHTDGVWSIAYSPDCTLLASSSDDQTIRLWHVETGRCINVLSGHTDRVRSVVFSPDQKCLASGSDDRTVKLWDIDCGVCIATFQGHVDRVWSVTFSPDGQVLATGSTDGTIRLWNILTRACSTILEGHLGWIRSVAYSHNGDFLISGSDDRTIRLWDVSEGRCLQTFVGHHNRVWSVAFHTTDQMIMSSSEDHSIRLWDSRSGLCLRILQAHIGGVRAIAMSADGSLLVSGGDDQAIRVWEISSGTCLKILSGYANRVWSVAFHPENQTFMSSSEDQHLRVWKLKENMEAETLDVREAHTHGARSVVCSPDGKVYASAGEDQTVRLWDNSTHRCLDTFRGHTNWIRAVAFSPDGSLLVSGGEDNTVRVWSIQTKQCIAILHEHTSWVRAVAFSPNGNVVASGGDDGTIRLWNVHTGICIGIFREHSARVRSVVFSPDNELLVSCGEDQKIYLWDIDRGVCLTNLEGHSGWVRSISFNSSGAQLASGGDDGNVFLWDIATRTCIQKLHGHIERIRTVSFHPHDPLLLSGSDDGTIRLWNTETYACKKIFACEKPYEDMNISDVTGLTDAQKASLLQLGAVEGEE